MSDAPAVTPPAYADLAGAYNDRVSRLGQIYGRGVVQLAWTDRDGTHHEQGDVDLWIRQPRETAMLISKLGERLFWLGSNDTHYWFFDAKTRPSGAGFGRHDATVDDAALALPVEPLALLDLMGIRPLPDAPAAVDATQLVQPGDDDTTWLVVKPAGRHLAIISVNRTTLLPERVELIAVDTGRTMLVSTLKRYQRVAVHRAPPGTGGMMATLIDITDPETGGALKLSIRNPDDARDDVDPMRDRYFSPTYLMNVFEPTFVDGTPPDGITANPRPAEDASSP